MGLVLMVMGGLIFLDRMGARYGLREGWPWMVIALGLGGLIRNRRSVFAWIATILGILILGGKYYSLHLPVPRVAQVYFLPLLLMVIGLIWLFKNRMD